MLTLIHRDEAKARRSMLLPLFQTANLDDFEVSMHHYAKQMLVQIEREQAAVGSAECVGRLCSRVQLNGRPASSSGSVSPPLTSSVRADARSRRLSLTSCSPPCVRRRHEDDRECARMVPRDRADPELGAGGQAGDIVKLMSNFFAWAGASTGPSLIGRTADGDTGMKETSGLALADMEKSAERAHSSLHRARGVVRPLAIPQALFVGADPL
jgi:hypothetical protein